MNFRNAVRVLFASAIIVAARVPAQTPVWSQFPNSPAGTTRNDDFYFVDPLHGWTARETDGVYRTTNGGNSWVRVLSNTNAVALFRCIGFVSETRGWVGNLGPGSFGSVTDTNVLYATTNGGDSWTPVQALNESGMKGFCAMHVRDSQHIYGAGRVRGPAYFTKTEDGGNSWFVTNLTTAGVMGGLMDVYFKDATNGFVVGMDTNAFNSCSAPFYHGAIARTTNGGLSWHVVANTTVNCSYFWKMSWPSTNVGYASLQQNGSPGTIIFYKTTDGGATWTSNGIPHTAIGVSSGTTWFLQSVGFVSETEGWMGGSTSGALTFNQNFIHTIDGGATWTTVGYDSTRGMNRIRFLSPTLGFGSGQKVHVFRVPLAITTQPTNQTVSLGDNVTLHAIGQGYAPVTYQWRFNGTNILGATTNTYSIANVQSADAGNYTLAIADYSGSVTSSVATLSVSGVPVAPNITSQPQSLTINPGSNATFMVIATGTAPLSYQWRFNGANISAATTNVYTRTNAQVIDLGNYSVVVTNVAGSVTSALASLTFGYSDDFDSYTPAKTVTNTGTTNGYRIVYRAAGGGIDFKAIFGFDYSTVTFPTNIPPAPHSVGGTTKGLYLTVNKDASGNAAAVNLYPTGQVFSGNFALKFDLWINWRDINTSTEHTLFGINHSGNVTNRITQSPSDGLFFAMAGEDDSDPSSSVLRDYSVFRGGGTGAPILMITNNTTFGPTPLLSPQFENYNPGFVALFPAQTIPGFGSTPLGTAGLKWLSGEVRQVNNLITWMLNGTAIAQYTNSFTNAFTSGTIMLGYNDHFASTGDTNNFAIFDNVRVEPIVVSPVQLLTPRVTGSHFVFDMATEAYESYTVQSATDVIAPTWTNVTNLVGNGSIMELQIPLGGMPPQYFRVSRP